MVGVDPRCRDFIAGAAFLFRQGKLQPAAGYPAYGRNAMPQPQLVGVLGLGCLGGAARVRMRVDNARHDVRTVCIDFVGRVLGARVLVDVETRVADTHDVLDPVLLDDDVHRPNRRRTRSVNEGCTANDEPLERADTFVPVRGRNHPRSFVLCHHRQGEKRKQ